MSLLKNKEIVLGISGSIAAYKSCDLIRRIQKENGAVTCILTESATKLVSEVTLQNLTHRKVYQDLFDTEEWDIEHISLSQKMDILVIAPTTANIIGKIASGIADDLLTSIVIATQKPVLIAPAMNSGMYQNPVVQENITKLKKRGFYFIGPEEGELACGENAIGRLADNDQIVNKIKQLLIPLTVNEQRTCIFGKTVLITAGPTREYIDPVRFISNSSSGKMGYALAETFYDYGAKVILISGPTSLKPPSGVKIIFVESANSMREQVNRHYQQTDIVVSTAAVSDYRPETKYKHKLKSELDKIGLQFIKNPDILWQLGKKKGNRLLIGFALETENLLNNAKIKLIEKNLDLIIANSVDSMAKDTSKGTILKRSYPDNIEIIDLPEMNKYELAEKIVTIIIELFNNRKKK